MVLRTRLGLGWQLEGQTKPIGDVFTGLYYPASQFLRTFDWMSLRKPQPHVDPAFLFSWNK